MEDHSIYYYVSINLVLSKYVHVWSYKSVSLSGGVSLAGGWLYISSDDVERLKEIVVDVIWDGVEQRVSEEDWEEGPNYSDDDGNIIDDWDYDYDDDFSSSSSEGLWWPVAWVWRHAIRSSHVCLSLGPSESMTIYSNVQAHLIYT